MNTDTSNYKDNIRIKIVCPLVIMLLLAGGLLALGFYKIEKAHLAKGIREATVNFDKLFGKIQNKETKVMTAQLQLIAQDAELINAWQLRNRAALFARANSIFKQMNTGSNVSHFYFLEPDKTCFLRVHAPEKFGDEITRFTLQEAADSSRISSGLELGVLGTFTLRVVYPWIINGKLQGFLEVGEEVKHLAPRLKEISGLDLIFTIDKQNLDKEKWQRGIANLPRADTWNDFAEFVIADKTMDIPADKLGNIIKQKLFLEFPLELSFHNRMFAVNLRPLHDGSGRIVGSVVIFYNTSTISTETRKAVSSVVITIMLVVLVILLFYYIYSGKIENQVDSYRHNLEELVRKRTHELHKALDEVKVLSGLLPICSSCKQIRDDNGCWSQIESYITNNSEAKFTHGICPGCRKKLYPDID